MMFTSGAVMMEKIIGLLERSMVAGMTYFEIIGAHLVVQFLLMALQTAIMLLVFYIFYSNPFLGDAKLVIALLFAVEVVGITYGFLLTEIFETERMVSYAGIGTTLAVFTLGGIIWPIDGAHALIRSCAWAFPVAPAVQSYNSIASKGYSMSHGSVYRGFLSCLIWSALFSALALILAKVKKQRRTSTKR
ncbi:hypothetical protein AAG570_011221 [Ranatra chinensis]|uniref:ABC-2 type transporter transmembrane domain-containing protein n=1 Tax=Ranatra chinensis TaxID=642074 RepID=A0ABD0YW76_9HEMI